MAQADTDASVIAHIQRLVGEEHKLFERAEPTPEDSGARCAMPTW
jgi:hypothetical protein